MHIHIIGICGTFMGSLAILAKSLGHKVTGCDAGVYPPMSTQLEAVGIELTEGFDVEQMQMRPDLYIVGNAISRGNTLLEAVFNEGLPYISGAQWLKENVLQGKKVIAISGTHGKTTTASMMTWLLECAGLNPGYLIGGVPENFEVSARLTDSDYFVIEADEYDTALFDKRSKFVHYLPTYLLINNIEFDHADIFDSIADIQKQFHHLMKIIPNQGCVFYPKADDNIQAVLDKGVWCDQVSLGEGGDWTASVKEANFKSFDVFMKGQLKGTIHWDLMGEHNVNNALACIAIANQLNIAFETCAQAFASFKNVKRRMQLLSDNQGICIYDDFAHHPTAIATTINGLRQSAGDSARLIIIIEPRSNTFKAGYHQEKLPESFKGADQVIWYQSPAVTWSIEDCMQTSTVPNLYFDQTDNIVKWVRDNAQSGDQICVMSNGGFEGIHQRLVDLFA